MSENTYTTLIVLVVVFVRISFIVAEFPDAAAFDMPATGARVQL